MDQNFTITVDKTYTTAYKLILKGRVTSANADILQHKLNEAFGDGNWRFVLNMRDVDFLSSGGIRVLLMFYKKTKEKGGSFHVENPSENVRNVLGMTALDNMLLK